MKVSVILPVYNGEDYIYESIKSILDQTYSDFEILIFNDASTDNTEKVISKFNDDRIRYFKNIRNRGYIYCLNLGIELSKGEYILRQDADDYSFKNRLSIQVEFMDNNPQIYMCCSNGVDFDDNLITKYNERCSMTAHLLLNNPIIHSSVCIRKSVFTLLDKKYDERFYYSEDYDLWIRINKLFKIHYLPDCLVKYRKHELQVSKLYNKKQVSNFIVLNQNLIEDVFNVKINSRMKSVIGLLFETNEEFNLDLSDLMSFCLIFTKHKDISLCNKHIIKTFVIKRFQKVEFSFVGACMLILNNSFTIREKVSILKKYFI